LVRAGFWSVSYKIHRRLCLFKFRPRTLLTGPLSTTFVHILRLKALLSTRKFKVITRPIGSIQKAQQIGITDSDTPRNGVLGFGSGFGKFNQESGRACGKSSDSTAEEILPARDLCALAM
jgi:hypothetical protein